MLNYLFHCTLIWALFALVFQLFLKKETFHGPNRLWVLASLLGGLLMPLLPNNFTPSAVGLSEQVLVLPTVVVGGGNVESGGLSWGEILILAYSLVALGFLLRLMSGFFKIGKLYHQSQIIERNTAYTLLETPFQHAPFSFFSWVFFEKNTDFRQKETQTMLQHELFHVRALHSYDRLLAELVCCLLWWHPLAWWHRHTIEILHEYAADEGAYAAQSAKEYGSILLNMALNEMAKQRVKLPQNANHFSKSHLKKRMFMLFKSKSAPVRSIQYALLVPCLFFLAWLMQSTTLHAQDAPPPPAPPKAVEQIDTIVTFNPETGEETVQIVKTKVPPPPPPPAPPRANEPPVPPSETDKRAEEKHIKWVRALEAKGWIEVDTVVTFDPKTFEESVAIVERNLSPKKDATGELVYEMPDQDPQFPGGQEAMIEYYIKNVKYPESAKKAGIEGRILVGFTVGESGDIRDAKVMQHKDDKTALEQEALRVVKAMPNWIPAKHKGKNVACKAIMPVQFKL